MLSEGDDVANLYGFGYVYDYELNRLTHYLTAISTVVFTFSGG